METKQDKSLINPFISRNPFVVESPEKLTAEQIVQLYVEEFTPLETVKRRKHTFIWGARGSGKSMLLRYLEPRCQAIKHGTIENFFEQPESYVAIYCPCKEGQLNRTELALLDKLAHEVITEHMLNLMIAARLIKSFREQIPESYFVLEDVKDFASGLVGLFGRASVAASLEQTDQKADFETEPFTWLQALFAEENRKVSRFLRDNALRGGTVVYEGATSGYHDFLLPVMRLAQRILRLPQTPIFLLLDDADKLTREQHSVINTWIANRDQANLCLKISTQRQRYHTFRTRNGGWIEEPHDYSEVDIDELYTSSTSSYFEKVKRISERRLQISPVPTKDVEQFFPPGETEEALREEIRRRTAEEWEKRGSPGRQNDYVDRYTSARLFQDLARRKQRKSYAGFENMVHLSSGVVRSFLEPCYLMFDECTAQRDNLDTIEFIPPSIQNEVLRKYSEDFYHSKFREIERDLEPERYEHLGKLKNLIQGLGKLFYDRLHDPEARDPRLFSFTVRGVVPEDVQQVLDLGEEFKYFQVRTYSTKEGGGREPWYILNRRLCPVFKLDPTGFEGRISLRPEHLRIAFEDPARFVRIRLRAVPEGQGDLFMPIEEDEEWTSE